MATTSKGTRREVVSIEAKPSISVSEFSAIENWPTYQVEKSRLAENARYGVRTGDTRAHHPLTTSKPGIDHRNPNRHKRFRIPRRYGKAMHCCNRRDLAVRDGNLAANPAG